MLVKSIDDERCENPRNSGKLLGRSVIFGFIGAKEMVKWHFPRATFA